MQGQCFQELTDLTNAISHKYIYLNITFACYFAFSTSDKTLTGSMSPFENVSKCTITCVFVCFVSMHTLYVYVCKCVGTCVCVCVCLCVSVCVLCEREKERGRERKRVTDYMCVCNLVCRTCETKKKR